jgi:hypothetical protein
MKRYWAFGLIVGVIALGLISVASASATSLPEFTVKTGFTGTGKKTVLESTKATKITCEESTSELAPTSLEHGTLTLNLKKCSSGGFKCNTSGDAEGVMLLPGEWNLAGIGAVDLGVERPFLLLTVKEVTATCPAIESKFTIKGNWLTHMTPSNSATTKYELSMKESKGKEDFVEYENNSGKKLKAELLVSQNGGAFESVGVESVENKLTAEKETVQLNRVIGIVKPTPAQEPVGIARLGGRVMVEFKNDSLVEPWLVGTATFELANGFVVVGAGNTCTGSINAGASCKMEIEYQNNVLGDKNGFFWVPEVLPRRIIFKTT